MQTQMLWRSLSVATVSFGLATAGAPAHAFSIGDAINTDKSPTSAIFWTATEVGWSYTPTVAYRLSGINTKFGAVTSPTFMPPRTVTLEVYDQHPEVGGALLRSVSFTAALNAFSGGSFAPLDLIAGDDYFIGFRNVDGLGVNETVDPGAVSLDPLRFSFANDGSYRDTDSGGISSRPILEFVSPPAAIPTPFLLPGLVGFGVKAWRKRQSQDPKSED